MVSPKTLASAGNLEETKLLNTTVINLLRIQVYMDKHQAESEEIINIMKEYVQTYIEKPNAMFGNMPICPFAKQARQDKKIYYAVYAFQPSRNLSQDSDLLDLIRAFRANQFPEVLMVIHPDKQAISLEEMKKLIQGLNKLIHPLGLIAFSGHPHDNFNIKGVLTRRDPFINFLIQDRQTLETSSETLKSTAYYDNWTLENLDSIKQVFDQS